MVRRYTCSAAATMPGGPVGLQLPKSLPSVLLLLLLVVIMELEACSFS
jgi:hypothetical protein